MLLLEALKGVKPKKKTRMSSIAGGALLLAGLGAAVPSMAPWSTSQGKSNVVRVLVGGQEGKELRPIPVNSDELVQFSKDVASVSISSTASDVLEAKVRDARTIVLTGKKPGRTSLTVIFKDGTDEQAMVTISADVSVLGDALKRIAPGIEVELAPDRDAIVLSGTVSDEAASRRAFEAAQDYVNASRPDGKGKGAVINLLRLQAPAATFESRLQGEVERMGVKNVVVRRVVQGGSPDDAKDVFVVEGAASDITTAGNVPQLAARLLPGEGNKKDERIVSRITISDVPMSVEQVMQTAIRDLGCPKVRVRRVVSTEFPGEGDIVVLEGSVPTQTHLVRAVTLASKIFQQQEVTKRKRENKIEVIREIDPSGQSRTFEKEPKLDASADDIKVVADESGAIKRSRDSLGNSSSAIGSVLGAGGGSSAAGNQGLTRLLQNQVDSNIARAKVLELAEGRVLSFLTVEDLPQVRVDIKLYEINRTALLTWNSQQSGAVSDFNRPSTLRPPTFVTNPVTGELEAVPNTTPTSNPDFQNVVSFLGGGISNRFRISGSHVEIDSLLSLLEREGIARSLSSPSLTVLSGELAFFGVGGSVPVESNVVTQFGNGVSTGVTAGGVSGILNTTVEREFGIRLSVRPLVEESDMITLDVIPSVSQPDSDLTRQIRESTGQSLSTTAFQERSMRTSARLHDGQTLLIGGLSSKTRTDNTDQVPFLHELPIIGHLFKGYSYGDDDRELVIVVNPVIVREASKEAPMWAFPSTKELMGTIPTKASLRAKSEPAAQAEKQ